MDVEEKLWVTFLGGVILALFTVAALVLINLAQPKEFNGYYLYHGGLAQKVYINWENRVDEEVYRSYNREEAIRVFERLQAAGDPTK